MMDVKLYDTDKILVIDYIDDNETIIKLEKNLSEEGGDIYEIEINRKYKNIVKIKYFEESKL
jgi:hypothetical protein